MKIHSSDHTIVSFGKLSDPGVLRQSPLADDEVRYKPFTSKNFQYIVNHIAEIFGLAHGSVQAAVVKKKVKVGWVDQNQNASIEPDEIVIQFAMNAAINTYTRTSYYEKHFMYYTADRYGYPAIFGIAAHEVGHLICRYAMSALETKFIGGDAVLVQTSALDPRWDELCSDYLSGIVLAKAVPRLNQNPLIECLRNSRADDDHPDGFWRVYAIEMGYQWGCNNSPALTSRILSDALQIRQLLQSFCQLYYRQIYCGVNARDRSRYSRLPSAFSVPCEIPLGTL